MSKIQLTEQEVDKIHNDFCDAFEKQMKKHSMIENAVYQTYKQGLIDQQEYLNWSCLITDKAYQKAKDDFYIEIPVRFKLKQ